MIVHYDAPLLQQLDNVIKVASMNDTPIHHIVLDKCEYERFINECDSEIENYNGKDFGITKNFRDGKAIYRGVVIVREQYFIK